MGEVDATVFVVDDDASVRKGLSRLLRSAGHHVEVFPSAEAFLEHQAREGVGCLVLDLQMEGLTGIDLQKTLDERDDPIPIIFLTGYGDIPTSVSAMKGGAVDFLTKPVDAEALLGAIRHAFLRHEEALARREELQDVRRRIATLTPREHEIMRYVVSGALNKQIGFSLGIAEKTVKVHRGRVMEKMGVLSVAELVRLCALAGIEPTHAT